MRSEKRTLKSCAICWNTGKAIFQVSYTPLSNAAGVGDLDTMKWLLAQNVEAEEGIDHHYIILSDACEHGHLSIVKWLFTTIDYFLMDYVNFPSHAIGYGKCTHKIQRLFNDTHSAADSAARWGHLDILITLFNDTHSAADSAARWGHLDILKFFERIGKNSQGQCEERHTKRLCIRGRYPYFTTLAIDSAAGNGHLDVVKWLVRRGQRGTPAAMENAAANGHLEITKWLRWNRFKGGLATVFDRVAATCFHFSSCKHKDINSRSCCFHKGSKRLHHFMRRSSAKCSVDKMPSMFYKNQLEILCWLKSSCSEDCSAAAIDGAAATGNLTVLHWLQKNTRVSFTTKAMDSAAGIGRLDVVMWLHELPKIHCAKAAMDSAAAGGYLKVVQWLHANRTEGCTANAMNWAASNGHTVRAEIIAAPDK
ncbi:hypothetical protein PHMEG_00023985 [Phytophthora megakarya]|uniref:Uncharacterized protein n=1 Tax=Phytophthora megakarya TaxID=4795 RepID=A0A225VH15_9STRA|nr:hypothetical protein PHMEG_00023985 [Phytophthora megakarya]